MATVGRWLIGLLVLSTLGLSGCAGPASQEASASRSERLLEQSRLVLRDFLDDDQYQRMRVYVQNAYAIMIAPDLLKGGFIAGAERGTAIMMVRHPETGNWGQPAFYDIYGGSLGLQFGVKSSDLVLTVMNEGRRQEDGRLRLQAGGGRLGCGGAHGGDRRCRHHHPLR